MTLQFFKGQKTQFGCKPKYCIALLTYAFIVSIHGAGFVIHWAKPLNKFNFRLSNNKPKVRWKETVILPIILLSCLCGNGQTITKEQYQKQLDRLNALDTLPVIKSGDSIPFNIRNTALPNIGIGHMPTEQWYITNYDAFDSLQRRITALQARVDSLIEAMRPRPSRPFRGIMKNVELGSIDTIWDTFGSGSGFIPSPNDDMRSAEINRNPPYMRVQSDWTEGDNGIPQQEGSGTAPPSLYYYQPEPNDDNRPLYTFGRNKGGVDGKGIIEFDKDSVLHPTPAAQRRMNRDLNKRLRYDSVTAYLIDTRAHTIAIDHRTKLPHTKPVHPVEGTLVEYKPMHFCYFDGGRWVILKEVK